MFLVLCWSALPGQHFFQLKCVHHSLSHFPLSSSLNHFLIYRFTTEHLNLGTTDIWTGQFFAGGTILCIVGCVAAAQIPVTVPSPRCLQTRPNMPRGTKLPLTENHWVKVSLRIISCFCFFFPPFSLLSKNGIYVRFNFYYSAC